MQDYLEINVNMTFSNKNDSLHRRLAHWESEISVGERLIRKGRLKITKKAPLSRCLKKYHEKFPYFTILVPQVGSPKRVASVIMAS